MKESRPDKVGKSASGFASNSFAQTFHRLRRQKQSLQTSNLFQSERRLLRRMSTLIQKRRFGRNLVVGHFHLARLTRGLRFGQLQRNLCHCHWPLLNEKLVHFRRLRASVPFLLYHCWSVFRNSEAPTRHFPSIASVIVSSSSASRRRAD